MSAPESGLEVERVLQAEESVRENDVISCADAVFFADYVVNELISRAFSELPSQEGTPTEEESASRVQAALVSLMPVCRDEQCSDTYRAPLAYYIFLTGSAFRVSPELVLEAGTIWFSVEDPTALRHELELPEPEWLEFIDFVRDSSAADVESFVSQVDSICQTRLGHFGVNSGFSRFGETVRQAAAVATARVERLAARRDSSSAATVEGLAESAQSSALEEDDGVSAPVSVGPPKFCTQCGNRLVPEARFCTTCGHPLAGG